MSDSDREWASVTDEVSTLVSQQRLSEAQDLLRNTRSEAAQSSPWWAAHFSSMLASLLLIGSRDLEALDAYREAERLDPSDPSIKLDMASCLLYYLDRPSEALQKARDSLALLSSRRPEVVSGEVLAGVALLRLGKAEEATAIFERHASAGPPRLLPAVSCDLRLAAEMVNRGLSLVACRHYLEDVLAKARTDDSPDVVEQVEALLAELERREAKES